MHLRCIKMKKRRRTTELKLRKIKTNQDKKPTWALLNQHNVACVKWRKRMERENGEINNFQFELFNCSFMISFFFLFFQRQDLSLFMELRTTQWQIHFYLSLSFSLSSREFRSKTVRLYIYYMYIVYIFCNSLNCLFSNSRNSRFDFIFVYSLFGPLNKSLQFWCE